MIDMLLLHRLLTNVVEKGMDVADNVVVVFIEEEVVVVFVEGDIVI
jgi:hypothetical protein